MLGRAEVQADLHHSEDGYDRRLRSWSRARSYAPAHCRLVRDGVQVYEGRARLPCGASRTTSKEVPNATECGIGIENYSDIKVGDEIEVFEVEELPATL